jgi:hypothetical protein
VIVTINTGLPSLDSDNQYRLALSDSDNQYRLALSNLPSAVRLKFASHSSFKRVTNAATLVSSSYKKADLSSPAAKNCRRRDEKRIER